MKAIAKGMATLAATLILVACGKSVPLATSPLSATMVPASPLPSAKPSSVAPTPPRETVEGPFQAKPLTLPTHTQTKEKLLGDPVNMAVVGSEEEMLAAFAAAGWVGADSVNLKSTIKMVVAAITFKPYDTAPMSDLYLFGRVQDYNFQKNQFSVHTRDHLRVWASGQKNEAGRPVWAVAATKDIAIKWDPATRATSHQIDPFIDDERRLVEHDLVDTGRVTKRWAFQQLKAGYRGVNGSGDGYTTDGQVVVLELKAER